MEREYMESTACGGKDTMLKDKEVHVTMQGWKFMDEKYTCVFVCMCMICVHVFVCVRVCVNAFVSVSVC